MPDIERVELPGGAWWEIRIIVTRGLRKAFRKAGLKVLSKADGVDFSDPDAFRKALMSHPDALDLDAVDDAYLLAGSVAWSYPETITLEAIDKLPEGHVAIVLAKMRELYAEATETARKN